MRPAYRAFLSWGPVVVWMIIIFSASSDSRSAQHSSRLIGPLLHWLFPNLPARQVEVVVFVARKCAHLTEYAILAVLIWRAFRATGAMQRADLDLKLAWRCLAIVALYAASDEFHQRFVPTREASVIDVLIDTSGAALALIFIWAVSRWRKIA